MNGLKRLTIALFAVVLLIILSISVAASRFGMPVILHYAINNMVDLSVGEISGGLTSSLSFQNIKYETNSFSITLDEADIALDLQCLLDWQICVEYAAVKQSSITIGKKSLDINSAESQSIERLLLPISVFIKAVDIQGLQVTISEQIERASLDSVPFLQRNKDSQIADLYIPLDLRINDFSVNKIAIQKADNRFFIDSLVFDVMSKGYDLNVDNLKLVRQNSLFSGGLEAELRQGFPVTGSLKASIQQEHVPNISANVDIDGSLEKLNVRGQVQAPFSTQLTLSVSPLKSDLPAKLQVEWGKISHQSLQPLSAYPFEVEAGFLEINGTINDYAMTASTQLHIAPLATPVEVMLNAHLKRHHVLIDLFHLKLLSGQVSSSGQLVLDGSFPWTLQTTITDLNGQLQDLRYPADINGDIETSGLLQNGSPNLYVDHINLRATQQGHPLAVQGKIAIAKHLELVVASVDAVHQDNRLQGFTRIVGNEQLEGDLIVSINELNHSIPNLSGEIRGNILAMGSLKSPQIELDLDLYNIKTLDNQTPTLLTDKARFRVTGSHQQQTVSLDAIRNTSAISLGAQLTTELPEWQAKINSLDIAHNKLQFGLYGVNSIKVTPQSGHVLIDNLCLQSELQENVCVRHFAFDQETALFDLAADDLLISSLLTATSTNFDISTRALVDLHSKGHYSKSAGLDADVVGRLSPSNWYAGEKTFDEPIDLQTGLLNARIVGSKVNASLQLETASHGSLSADLNVMLHPENANMNIQIDANDIKIAPLSYFNRDINNLDGSLSGNLAIHGDLDSPSIEGKLNLAGGKLDIERAPALLENWSAEAIFLKKRAELNSQFVLGDGQGKLQTTVDWRRGLSVQSELTGNDLSLEHKESKLVFTPDLAATLTPEKVRIDGAVTVTEADIVLTGIPQNAITPSNDVHLRGEPKSTSYLDHAEISVDLALDPKKEAKVQLAGFGLEASLAGQLQLEMQPSPMMFGDLQVLNGQYEAYGQALIIRSGEIQFNGPFSQPILFVEAIRDPNLTQDDVIAGVVIEGLANGPNIRLFAEPDMDQGTNLAYLLSGKGDVGGSAVDNNAFTSLLVGFGVSSSDGLTGNMGKALGIDDLQLDARGSGNETQLAVSGTIAPKLTLEYGVGVFDSVSEVKLRYELMPKLYVEAISGIEDSLLIFYEFSVGQIEQQTLAIE